MNNIWNTDKLIFNERTALVFKHPYHMRCKKIFLVIDWCNKVISTDVEKCLTPYEKTLFVKPEDNKHITRHSIMSNVNALTLKSIVDENIEYFNEVFDYGNPETHYMEYAEMLMEGIYRANLNGTDGLYYCDEWFGSKNIIVDKNIYGKKFDTFITNNAIIAKTNGVVFVDDIFTYFMGLRDKS
jgi:hypothetical protein